MIVIFMIQIYSMLIFVRVLMSWFPVDERNTIVETLYTITDPYLNIFRSIIPPLGGMDFSPIIALIVLRALSQALMYIM